MGSMTGKTAVVTGGSRGIGRAICLELARRGANVVFSYAGNTAAADKTLEELQALGVEARAVQGDVADPAAAKALIDTAVKELAAAGYVTLVHAGRGREKTIVLTEAGRAYTGRIVGPIAAAERQALEETLGRYAMDFIDAYDHFAQALCRALELKNSPGDHDERIV